MLSDDYSDFHEVFSPSYSLRGKKNVFQEKLAIDEFYNNDLLKQLSYERRQAVEMPGPIEDEFSQYFSDFTLEDDARRIDRQEKMKKPVSERIVENFDNMDERCDTIVKHLETCAKCRKYVLSNFSAEETTDEILQIIIYGITGVFILFILDLFFKKGLSMTA